MELWLLEECRVLPANNKAQDVCKNAQYLLFMTAPGAELRVTMEERVMVLSRTDVTDLENVETIVLLQNLPCENKVSGVKRRRRSCALPGKKHCTLWTVQIKGLNKHRNVVFGET